MRILLPRLSPRPYTELPKVRDRCVQNWHPVSLCTLHLRYSRCPLTSLGLAGHGLLWEACRRPNFFTLAKSHGLLVRSRCYYDLVHGESWGYD